MIKFIFYNSIQIKDDYLINLFSNNVEVSQYEVEKYLNSGLNQIMLNSDFDYFYLIDFGLSYVALGIEDKAVDLYVLKKAMISVNPKTEEIVFIYIIYVSLIRW